MAVIHFLNVLEGDCNIIQHNSGRLTVMDVSNAYNAEDTPEEKAAKMSKEREEKRKRTNVPSGKTNYRQKETPDNPIEYLKNNIGAKNISRFIISHPDMDHIDGIKDLYTEFKPTNTWDTDNNKEISLNDNFAGYNKEDWKFYTELRAGRVKTTKRLTPYVSRLKNNLWSKDGLTILCPSKDLVKRANEKGDYNDASYVILYTTSKKDGKSWKIIFAGDSDDHSWEHILKHHSKLVSNVDVLMAPHHGRDSGRNYNFLEVLKPRVTLMGNASSRHLAYSCYRKIRITNNQAGFVVIDVTPEAMTFYVKHFDFARDFRHHRGWGIPVKNNKFNAYPLFKFDA
jgi:beta-lactamase superfamily II metal-dependent hydrolase